jgi:hypothetical protein
MDGAFSPEKTQLIRLVVLGNRKDKKKEGERERVGGRSKQTSPGASLEPETKV